MSPIFLWFDDSFESCVSKCSERIVNKKSEERSGKPSLLSNTNCSTNRLWVKLLLWFSQRELIIIIDGLVIDLYSFIRQWIHFCYRTKDFFRLDSNIPALVTFAYSFIPRPPNATRRKWITEPSSVMTVNVNLDFFPPDRNDEMKRRELTFICLWALMAVVSGGCKNPCVSESYRAYQQWQRKNRTRFFDQRLLSN